MEGNIAFGFWSPAIRAAVPFDPTYGSLILRTRMFDYLANDYVTLKEVELESVSNETNPEYFYENSPLESLIDTSEFYTAKDFSEIVL